MMPAYSRMVARVKEMQRCNSRVSRRQTLKAFGDGGMAAIIMHRSPKNLRIQEFGTKPIRVQQSIAIITVTVP
jgi:hypothetical protein